MAKETQLKPTWRQMLKMTDEVGLVGLYLGRQRFESLASFVSEGEFLRLKQKFLTGGVQLRAQLYGRKTPVNAGVVEAPNGEIRCLVEVGGAWHIAERLMPEAI